jgi:hypothetical protein
MLDLMSRMTARINTLESELSGRKPAATPASAGDDGGCFEWRGGKLR